MSEPVRPISSSDAGASDPTEEYTIDELAARAGMTVRNVRAYAGRGLIAGPRLEGRTGYYRQEHLQRLQLVRELVDRGYTLAAVEQAVRASPASAAGHTMDLLNLLDQPQREVEPEIMTVEALSSLAGVTHDDSLIRAMAEFGLLEPVEDDPTRVRLLLPNVVRSGAAAVALGLPASAVIEIFPVVQENLRTIADEFVERVAAAIVQPFLDAGLPEEQWAGIFESIQTLLSVASQVTLGIFRHELSESIDAEIGTLLGQIDQ
ncbi:MerR family transcriptional regulator [Aeromicrobium sp. CF4.19]|uniref:MerR family transcriptional regulator n=1 Tax=Aeromicrobium sp. CF4.19 TaxID=3373082 RepID=UPI003EE71C69